MRRRIATSLLATVALLGAGIAALFLMGGSTGSPVAVQVTGSAFATSAKLPLPTVVPPAPSSGLTDAYSILVSTRTHVQGLSSSDKKTAKTLGDVVKHLGDALASALWPAGGDGNHVDPSKGAKVFDGVTKALISLSQIRNAPAGWHLGSDASDLLFATRLLASTAIADNSCSPLKPKELDLANMSLSVGDTLYGQHQYPSADINYSIAWTQALKARGTNSCGGQTMPITGGVVGLYPGFSTTLTLSLNNPNPFAASVTGLTITPADASLSCPASYLQIGAFTGPLTIPANSTGTTSVSIGLSSTAPDACQGATFPLTYTAQAVQQ